MIRFVRGLNTQDELTNQQHREGGHLRRIDIPRTEGVRRVPVEATALVYPAAAVYSFLTTPELVAPSPLHLQHDSPSMHLATTLLSRIQLVARVPRSHPLG